MGNCCCCCAGFDEFEESKLRTLSQPVFARSTSIARRPMRLTMRKHLIGNTFDVITEDDQKIFEIRNDWTSFIHHTKEIKDGRTGMTIAEIEKRALPWDKWRHKYSCKAVNGNHTHHKKRHHHRHRRGREQSSADTPKHLFHTQINFKLIGQDPTILHFRNQGRGGESDKLKYKDKRFTRYNPVTWRDQTVATIKKNFTLTSREYELEIAQGMDYFLIVGLAVIHDDNEARERRQD